MPGGKDLRVGLVNLFCENQVLKIHAYAMCDGSGCKI